MDANIIGWDLEIARPFPTDGSTWQGRGLGVSCAVAYHLASGRSKVWRAGILDSHDSQMRPGVCLDLLSHLALWQEQGYIIASWNGLGFDYPFLIEAAVPAGDDARKWVEEARKAALNHTDPGFLMVCQRGFMIGLEACAEALSLPGKTEGFSGTIAPFLWSGIPDDFLMPADMAEQIAATGLEMGSAEARQAVVDYCIQDAKVTAQVAERLARVGPSGVKWLTKKGTRARVAWRPKVKEERGSKRLLTCAEAVELPKVNTSWMTDPRPRSHYIGWTLGMAEDAEA